MKKPGLFYIETRSFDAPTRTLTATISSGVTDRWRTRLDPNGCQVDNFIRNPVVQWAHDYSQPPIAKALWVRPENGKIRAQMQFADYPFAQQIFDLYSQGFLNAFSVGFDPSEWSDDAEGIRTFTKWDLLEFSAVPVPANPEALKDAFTRGIIAQEFMSRLEGDASASEQNSESPAEPSAPEPEPPEKNQTEDHEPKAQITESYLNERREFEKRISEQVQNLAVLIQKSLDQNSEEKSAAEMDISEDPIELSRVIGEAVRTQIKNLTGKI